VSDELDFTDAKVLVVGGSSGIGHAIAVAFHSRGAQVCVTGTRPGPDDYAGEGADFTGLSYRQLDAADRPAVQAFAPPFAGLSVLVNSQGLAPEGGEALDLELFDRMLAVNLTSVMQVCARFHAELAASRGTVISIGSSACFMAVPHRLGYSAAKGGLLTLTKSLAAAWAPEGIRVNGLAPGYVETRMTAARRADPQRYEAARARIPMGRWGRPEDVAGVALLLASPLGAYVTGQMIAVDGGLTL
jgi:3-oxoacyl-[acyl-carrier protein] reductase